MERIANFFIIIGIMIFIIGRILYILNYTSSIIVVYIIRTIGLLIGITGSIIKKRNNN